MRTVIAAAVLLLAACDVASTSAPPPFSTPPQCNSPVLPTVFTPCSDVPGATATTSTMFAADCYLCSDAVGHAVAYVAQPGDPSGTNDLSCFWNDGVANRICVIVCVPATQDHRGCPP